MKYRLLWVGALVGVGLHLAGLGVDVYLHAQDSTLAAREGLFTLSNPGHALIVAGMALTAVSVLGVAFSWANERRLGGTGALASVARAISIPAIGFAAFGTVWLASLAEDSKAHDHGLAAAVHDDHGHDSPVAVAASAADANHPHPATGTAEAMAAGNAHTHGTEVPVTAEQLASAAAFTAHVSTSIAKYEDIRVAMAAGYFQLTQDLPGIAAHFMNAKYNSDGILMDPEKPEFLLYTKRLDGTWRLVGAMFSSEKVTPEPPSFFGPLDAWHLHENLCFTPNAVSIKPNAAECPGVFVKDTPWNLHVWTAPGGAGVFAHDFPPVSPGAFPGAVRPAAQDLVVRAP
jgi:hypothetical protein